MITRETPARIGRNCTIQSEKPQSFDSLFFSDPAKSMRCARILLAGIETMHMIHKGQLRSPRRLVASASQQFYSLAY